ncbi:putative actin-binding protein anillin-like isoform X2 [Apostichopus japonicus]|uniref:Putative actin-binding protein anillin-like isoform X2 n=1 Tax=Stichopus japonicus TaxID=307972 RepID=A0A2G8KZI1_STIJA|nr:putative actin-binding protein anillin-like isoform X2 [Apostichopus japonicus]
MDPLTQRLLERTRARREDLAKKMAENKMESQKRKAPLGPSTTINSMEDKSHQVHSQKSGPEMSPSSGSPKTSMKKRFNTLATQRAQWDVQKEGKDLDSSPVLPKLQTRQEASQPAKPVSNQPIPPSRKSRFAALAANINSWEDDTNHTKPEIKQEERPVKKWKRPAPAEPQEESRPSPPKREATQTRMYHQIQPRSPIKKSLQKNEEGTNQNADQMRPTMSRAARFQLGSSRLGDGGFQTATGRDVILPHSSKCTAADKPSVQPEPRAAPRTNTAPHASPRSKKVEEKKEPTPKKRPGQEQDTGTANKKQATSTVVAQAKKGLEASSRDAPSNILSPQRVEAKVGAMAKSIHDRLKAHQNNWQSNEISKKIQADRMKDLAVLKNRWVKSDGEVRKHEPEEEEEKRLKNRKKMTLWRRRRKKKERFTWRQILMLLLSQSKVKSSQNITQIFEMGPDENVVYQ